MTAHASGPPSATVPSPRWRESFDLLADLLPPGAAAYEAALLHSGIAFEWVDRWLGFQCLEVLQGGELSVASAGSAGRTTEFPLAPLLTAAVEGQQWTGLPLVKALLVVGVVMGRPEARLMVTLAEGARRARRANLWQRCLPPAMSGDVGFAAALAHCRDHAQACLASPTGLPRAELAWLEALQRWCELLAKPAPGLTWLLREPRRVEVVVSIEPELDDIDECMSTLLTVEEPDPSEDGQVLSSGSGLSLDESAGLRHGAAGDEDLLPVQVVPEASVHHVQSPAPEHASAETEPGAQARQARTGFRTALQNQHLPWVNDQLAPDDAQTLRDALQLAMASDRGDLPAGVGLLALAHVTGQMLEQVAALSLIPCEEASYLTLAGHYCRWVPPQNGAWVPELAHGPWLRAKASHLVLALPETLRQWLMRRIEVREAASLGSGLGLAATLAVAQARSWLADLRRRSGGLQTLSRVEWWLSSALYQARLDHVPAHLLCAAHAAQVCPAAYYRAYRAADLEQTHHRVLVSAGWQMPLPTCARTDAIAAWVGSNLNPRPEAVATLWSSTTTWFEHIVQDEGRPLHERHNAREVHEVLMLVFQTMHRIVGDPLESLAFMDLGGRRRLVIADKQQGDARVHRMVPLASLAQRQCQEHVEHVMRLVHALSEVAPETALRLATMLVRPEDRTAPFRFLLNARGEIVRLTPKALRQATEACWHLPLNLGRHFLSTWLLEQGVSDQALVALLGHHDLGTQSLSLFSPLDVEALFAPVRPLLDRLNDELGLRSIPSFLPAQRGGNAALVARTAPPSMLFGHALRDVVRARQALQLKRQSVAWIRQQLDGRAPGRLNQDDVVALFDRARRASPNRRSFAAAKRLESLRDALVVWTRDHGLDNLELPAVDLFAADQTPSYPSVCLWDAAWLDQLRQGLRAFWAAEFKAWRAARETAYTARPESLVLSLIVEAMVVDRSVWAIWFAQAERSFDVFEDGQDRVLWRACLANGNVRLMPVRRAIAEMLLRVPEPAMAALQPLEVTRFANALTPARRGPPAVQDFNDLLARVRDGWSADAPGLVLGYADGSLAAVSPEMACLQRATGGWPPLPATPWPDPPAGHSDDQPAVERQFQVDRKGAGSVSDVGEFRRRVSALLRVMNRTNPAAKPDPSKPSSARADTAEVEAVLTAKAAPSQRWRPGPVRRLVEALEAQWDDLVASAVLPPVCSLAVQWIHSLAKHGQASGEAYAPKTLLNYWYSWALRIVEEFGQLDPTRLSSAEMEELYLQIIDSAAVTNRQHLYAPLRNWHRYLCQNHGADDITWGALRAATGQGLDHVDANLVHEHEYARALELLRADPAADAPMRAMQSAVLVLVYRFGLRISECLGMRPGDLVQRQDRGDWMVRVRGHLYRGLKTDSARRVALPLAPLQEREQAVLSSWQAHRCDFASPSTIQPLFATATATDQTWRLLPRRWLAMRVAQALRVACADPGVRVHHCRHSYATRALMAAVAEEATGDQLQFRGMLTSDPALGLRSVWAVAALLGHASPATTFATYSHAGHEWLADWLQRHPATEPEQGPAGDWQAFACGVRLKTWQRARQRRSIASKVAALNAESDLTRSWPSGSRVRPIAAGRPVDVELQLPVLASSPTQRTLLIVDRIIEHARRFGRVDGLAERCLVPEDHVAHVLKAAALWAQQHRTPVTPAGQWWIEGSDLVYGTHEDLQVQQALLQLEQVDAGELARAGALIARFFAPFARMVVIESLEVLDSLVRLCDRLLDDRRHLALLVPAGLDAEIDPALLEAPRSRSSKTRRARARLTAPLGASVSQTAAGHPSGAAVHRLIARAHELGISAHWHARVAGARENRHDRFTPSLRCGLRVQENAVDRLRSAKVLGRVLATVAVASQLRPVDPGSPTAGHGR